LLEYAVATAADVLSRFASSGVCTVNGSTVPFSIATATRFYQIANLPPADFYDVRLSCNNLVLRTIVPYDSPYLGSKPLDIQSTVKAWVMEKYKFTKTQMTNLEIKQEYVDSLATKFQGWIQAPAGSLTEFQNNWTNELASLATNIPSINSLTTDLTPAVDLTGTWKGTNCVFYNLNLAGQRALKLTGDITLKVKSQSGNAVTGTMALTITKQEKMPGIDGMSPEPNYPESTFTNGNISSTKFTFVYGYNTFEFETLSDSMRGKVSNRDKNTYAGLESDEGAFLLTREW
ncbi:MAG TPA: hypothetical protein PKM25_17920, partial [Candidatus Ozemobacteraceae bacterium]|nr:hypothetical protein [Candidatus Ozemobacteraceae bacterium]